MPRATSTTSTAPRRTRCCRSSRRSNGRCYCPRIPYGLSSPSPVRRSHRNRVRHRRREWRRSDVQSRRTPGRSGAFPVVLFTPSIQMRRVRESCPRARAVRDPQRHRARTARSERLEWRQTDSLRRSSCAPAESTKTVPPPASTGITERWISVIVGSTSVSASSRSSVNLSSICGYDAGLPRSRDQLGCVPHRST